MQRVISGRGPRRPDPQDNQPAGSGRAGVYPIAKVDSTVTFLGINVDDALSIAEQIDVRTREPSRCEASSCHSAEARHPADALSAHHAKGKNEGFAQSGNFY
jgi:hypothetical protein